MQYDCANYIYGAAYTYRVVNSNATGALYGNEGALQYCKEWCISEACFGFYYQEQADGREVCGLYLDASTFEDPDMNVVPTPGHKRGMVVKRDRSSAPCLSTTPLDGWVTSDCAEKIDDVIGTESVEDVVELCRSECDGGCVGFALNAGDVECKFYDTMQPIVRVESVRGVVSYKVQNPHVDSTAEIEWCSEDSDCAVYGDEGARCVARRCHCSSGFVHPVNRVLAETVYLCVQAKSRTDAAVHLSWEALPDVHMTMDMQIAASMVLAAAVRGVVHAVQTHVSNNSISVIASVGDANVLRLAGDMQGQIIAELERMPAFVGNLGAPKTVGSTVVDRLRCGGDVEVLYLDGHCVEVTPKGSIPLSVASVVFVVMFFALLLWDGRRTKEVKKAEVGETDTDTEEETKEETDQCIV